MSSLIRLCGMTGRVGFDPTSWPQRRVHQAVSFLLLETTKPLQRSGLEILSTFLG